MIPCSCLQQGLITSGLRGEDACSTCVLAAPKEFGVLDPLLGAHRSLAAEGAAGPEGGSGAGSGGSRVERKHNGSAQAAYNATNTGALTFVVLSLERL